MPLTLNTDEHQVLKMDLSTDNTEIVFTENKVYPTDFISTTDEKLYMISTIIKDDDTQTYLIKYYNRLYNEMDVCIKKNSNDNELADKILSNGIVQVYCFGDYVYSRKYYDYGAIGKIEDSQVNSLLISNQLRIAYNNKNSNDLYQPSLLGEVMRFIFWMHKTAY